MKLIKKIEQYLLVFLIIVFVGSCSDWLDGALPKDKNLEEQQYATEMGVNTVLNGIYREMAENGLYGSRLTRTDIELLAHYYYYNKNTNIVLYNGYTHFFYLSDYLNEYHYDEMHKTFFNTWGLAYSTVFAINTFIKNIEKTKVVSEEKRDVLLGEAYGLRAFLHFDLLRLFGNWPNGIPYNDSPEVIPHAFKTAEEVYDLILRDIATATDLLKSDPILTDGIVDFFKKNDASINNVPTSERFAYYLRNYRMNYYAVQALKARVLMNKGEKAAAAELASEILGETMPNLFKWANKNDILKTGDPDYIFYSEVIFGIFNPDLHRQWRDYTEGSAYGSVYASHIDNLQLNIFKYDATNSDMSNWADIRAKQWVPSKIGEGQYVSKKYDNGYSSAENNPKQYFQPLIRISELVYIMAEYFIDEGNIDGAMDVINFLLSVRGVSDEALRTASGKIEAYDILETEYYKEFYGEGQIFFYLKRRGYESMFKVDAQGRENVGSGAYLMPIPTSEYIND